MSLDEVALSGGRLTTGVVRVGQTVRRPTGPASQFTAALLDLLEQRGFAGSPRYLGRDSVGRDVLTFLPGNVPARFATWSDVQVGAAARLLRALHEATRGSSLAGDQAVVCHHDPGPNNTVFQEELPIAFIDFDTAAPGHPLEDLGYLAWTWCISSKASAPEPRAQARRVRAAADAYGLDGENRSQLISAILDRQTRNANFWRARLDAPDLQPEHRVTIGERIAWSLREHAHTSRHASTFAAALLT